MDNDKALFNLLEAHIGHNVEIKADKDENGEIKSLCLVCKECDSVILDAGVETIETRRDYLCNYRNEPYDEPIGKYTVHYKGHIFEGDTDEWNAFSTDKWDDAIGFYHSYSNDTEVCIKDNEYGVTFANGDWS